MIGLRKKNQRGVAIVEFLFTFFIFVFVLAVLYGSWGVVHSGILNSIAARTYATHVIANRSDLSFSKDSNVLDANIIGHAYFDPNSAEGRKNIRFFATSIYQRSTPSDPHPEFKSEKIKIDLGGNWGDQKPGIFGIDPHSREQDIQSGSLNWPTGQNAIDLEQRINSRFKTGLVHLKQGYGICLDAYCKGN